ncbi:MAG: type II toxin-antitoxin system RelB/DinJ family antitoxin [Firmicutes bacterium]|nr:type II toxin-antitoxin system RelB/DinJ family antitoxin [Bacillota bacterium]
MANVNIRLDDTLKRDTEGVLSEIGLSMSAATTLFYRQVVRYGGIPFELNIKRPNAETAAAIETMEAGVGVKNFKTPDELFAELNLEDD